jgi:thioester reductase-like protein
MPTAFFTGFPGFLGARLLPRVLARDPSLTATCLVQPKFSAVAHARAAELEATDPGLAGRIELIEGDITVPGLGVDDLDRIAKATTEVWHLAAVYDLSVPRDIGLRVNVDGTSHVLDLCERAAGLDRLHYVSTCYVSGRHAGPFRETDLDVGQRFNNFYEETKFLAEVDVRTRMDEGLPATVFRPAIVVGDHTTGETQKYDGPYYALQWLVRQRGPIAIMPVVGDPTAVRLNVVPSDFVLDAIATLAATGHAKGRVYQLADPAPPTVDELLELMRDATGHRRLVRVPLPRRLAKAAIDHVPGVRQVLGIPSSTVDYFCHPTFYDTTNTVDDLAGTGVACPPIASFLPTLVAFMRAHPDISAAAMV